MGLQELIAHLCRHEKETVEALWREAETKARQLRRQTASDIAEKKTVHKARREAVTCSAKDPRLEEAERRAGEIRLTAGNRLARRLYRLAVLILPDLRGEDYRRQFTALAAELPDRPWRTVIVHPDDTVLAAGALIDAEITTDPAVSGGLRAVTESAAITVDNTLEKRLERNWPFLLPGLIREVTREAENEPSVPET